MAEPGVGGKNRIVPASDVYTSLLIIATVFMILGTVFLAWKSSVLFGTWLPTGPAG